MSFSAQGVLLSLILVFIVQSTFIFSHTLELKNSKIAFESSLDGNSEIDVMDYDGKIQIKLTNIANYDGYARWPLDGKQIAFVSDRDGNGNDG